MRIEKENTKKSIGTPEAAQKPQNGGVPGRTTSDGAGSSVGKAPNASTPTQPKTGAAVPPTTASPPPDPLPKGPPPPGMYGMPRILATDSAPTPPPEDNGAVETSGTEGCAAPAATVVPTDIAAILRDAPDALRKLHEAGQLSDEAVAAACDPRTSLEAVEKIILTVNGILEKLGRFGGKKLAPYTLAARKTNFSRVVLELAATPTDHAPTMVPDAPVEKGVPPLDVHPEVTAKGAPAKTGKVEKVKPDGAKKQRDRKKASKRGAKKVAPQKTPVAAAQGSTKRPTEHAAAAKPEGSAARATKTGFDAEWAPLAHYLRSAGSDLARWNAARKMKEVWERLHPQTKQGAALKRRKGSHNEILSPQRDVAPAFVKKFREDTRISRATAARWVRSAEALVTLLGEAEVERLVSKGAGIATNPGGILAQVSRLETPKQAVDVVLIYEEGAGEVRAKEALTEYLAVQAEKARMVKSQPVAVPSGAAAESDAPAEDRVPFTCAVGDRVELAIAGKTVTIVVEKMEGNVATGFISIPGKRKTAPGHNASPKRASSAAEASWAAAVADALEQLPDDERSRAAVGHVEVIPPRACSACHGAWEWEDGRCADCNPAEPSGLAQSYEHEVQRLVLTVTSLAGPREIVIARWASGVHAGLTSRADIKQHRSPALMIADAGFLLLEGDPRSWLPELGRRVTKAVTAVLAPTDNEEPGDANDAPAA
jgi:hypothetical protein